MSLDLNKLANKLDEALIKETTETLTKFLNDKRMSNNKKIKSFLIVNQVKKRLENSTKMRDDDALLIADVWREELAELGAKSVYDVLNAIAGRMVTSPESIRRSRQKVQQDNANLRGNVYNQRHAKEIEVLKQLGYSK